MKKKLKNTFTKKETLFFYSKVKHIKTEKISRLFLIFSEGLHRGLDLIIFKFD